MVAKSKNRVTSIKTTQICWLKTAAWDFLTPARKQLTGNVSFKRTLAERYRNFYLKFFIEIFREKQDDEILARFKRQKLSKRQNNAVRSFTSKL